MMIDQPSILITDDDEAFRETLCGVFAPYGFRTLLAGDGEEALGIVRAGNIDLLLVDLDMPRLGGLETVRRVKAIERQLPCILLSARLDDAIRQQAAAADVFSTLAKPVSRLKITSSVELALRTTYGWG